MAEILLEADHVGLAYHELDGETLAVEDISFAVEKGEFLSIVGPSGCGKTSILSMIDGLMQPSRGRINLYGKSRPGYMLQRDHLLDWRTVEGNVLLGLQVKGMLNEETRAFTNSLLKTYGLSDFAKSYPRQLSGGMRQRVMIAMSLACDPRILIADEPTTALDVTIQAKIIELIRRVQKERGISVIYITHDLGVVANIADRVAVMYAGNFVEIGKAEEIFYDPRHPYTWALLSSLPQLGEKGEDLFTIKGTPPNLFKEVVGDAFAPRNPRALKIDYVQEPPFFEVTPTHKAKTWLLDPRAPKVEPPLAVRLLKEEGM